MGSVSKCHSGGCSIPHEVPAECCSTSCAASAHTPSKMDRVWTVLETISILAIGVFALYISWKLFLPFFIVGIPIGMYLYYQENKGCPAPTSGAGCSQDFIEQRTGIRLPFPITLIAGVAMFACHLEHHATVFVPLAGIPIGAWCGKKTMEFSDLALRTVYHYGSRMFS